MLRRSVLGRFERGLKLAIRGQDRQMFMLRLFALLTVACMTWLGIVAAFMNRRPGTDT